MSQGEETLAKRLGTTAHVSPLRMKLERLSRQFPSSTAASVEDWLVDVANDRGARIVVRDVCRDGLSVGVPEGMLSSEELVVGICLLQALDRPQMLRLAAQLISRQALDMLRLCRLAERERAGAVLAALARAALRVSPKHVAWSQIISRFGGEKPLRDTLLHWTRLAEPVMMRGGCNAQTWSLVA